jgi:hypothetical protein
MNGENISLTYAILKPIDSKPKSRKPEPEKNENIQGIGHWELGMGNWELGIGKPKRLT